MSVSFEDALLRIPHQYRQQLRNYIEFGQRPHDPILLAILSGQLGHVIAKLDPDLGKVLCFLKIHCPQFSHGSVYEVARWEFMRSHIAKADRQFTAGDKP